MQRIAKLLNEPVGRIDKIISHFEHLSLYNSEDVRLLNEKNNALKTKIKSLGLDPADTHPEELFEALKVKLSSDFNHLGRAWGLNEQTASTNLVGVIEANIDSSPVLTIKCAAYKKLLRDTPPKKIMKLLGYRSIESLLKREDTRVIAALSRSLETGRWNDKLSAEVKKLASSAYEMRSIKVLDLTILKKKNEDEPFKVSEVPLMGAIAITGNQALEQPGAPALVLKALQLEDSIRAQSVYLSNSQFRPDFNSLAQRLYSGFEPLQATIDGRHPVISVADAQQLLSETGNNAYERFTSLHPALNWWKNTDSLAFEADSPVSLHIADLSESISNDIRYLEHNFNNFSQSFKAELLKKYLNYASVKDYLSDQIDGTLIALEELLTPNLEQPEFAREFSPAIE